MIGADVFCFEKAQLVWKMEIAYAVYVHLMMMSEIQHLKNQ